MYERYQIVLPDDLAPGQYRLVVGAVEAGGGQALAPHGPIYEQRPDSLVVADIWVKDRP